MPMHRIRRDGCEDWRMTRRALASHAGQYVPIPDDALDGLEAFARGGGLTRRNLLERGAGLMILAAAASQLAPRAILEAAAEQAAAAPDAPILVSLYLDGGNDGLNTLVPLRDGRYRDLRTRVAVPAGDTLPLPDTAEFGWHPALPGLAALYREGRVAVLPAVDYAEPDQSHFNSQGYWRTGVVGPNVDSTGWLGRTLDTVGGVDNPMQGVSVSWGLDPVLRSRRAPVGTVFDPGSFRFGIPDVWREDGFTQAYREASRGARTPGLAAAQRAYRNAFDMVDLLAPLRTGEGGPPPTPLPYPDSDLGKAMRNLARMLGAGFGTRVAAVHQGGYDTHDQQATEHAELLGDLDGALTAFQADLTARGLADRVLTMVWSEFGRRPQDNDGGGTDHGAGGLLLLVGNRANGGIRSEWPGLARLDEDDNLLVTTEFRTVYASLLEQWLGVEAPRVLPGVDGRRIPLVRG
jgi:uncharacterized protein (DUF1501 family)